MTYPEENLDHVVSQSTPAPTAKVAAAGVSGAAALLLTFIAAQLGIDLDPGVGEAAVLLASVAGGYFKRSRLRDR